MGTDLENMKAEIGVVLPNIIWRGPLGEGCGEAEAGTY